MQFEECGSWSASNTSLTKRCQFLGRSKLRFARNPVESDSWRGCTVMECT
jgi:hypothetical protein